MAVRASRPKIRLAMVCTGGEPPCYKPQLSVQARCSSHLIYMSYGLGIVKVVDRLVQSANSLHYQGTSVAGRSQVLVNLVSTRV